MGSCVNAAGDDRQGMETRGSPCSSQALTFPRCIRAAQLRAYLANPRLPLHIVYQETQRLLAEAPPGIEAIPHDDNLRFFDVTITGPDSSPYAGEYQIRTDCMDLSADKSGGTVGGLFKLELFLPEEYPMAPPKVRFLTKIYHPFVPITLSE